MTLPADVGRCSGAGDDSEGWREGCADCLRRTDRAHWPQTAWVAPPPVIAFDCELRIAPDDDRATAPC